MSEETTRKKHKTKFKMTKPQLKAKIHELKIQRGQALEDRDEKKSVAWRYPIRRLKKVSCRLTEAQRKSAGIIRKLLI